MAWIKRNLTFVIGGLVALGLLGGAGFYIYSSLNLNSDARVKLNEIYASLDALNNKNPSPGNEQVDNIAAAIDQRRQLTNWMASVTDWFQPVPTIPRDSATDSSTFRSTLAVTIKQLQDDAATANVALPNSNYGFSFEAYRNQLNLPVASLPRLSVQLGEVKAITDILLSARINGLDGIQRLRVSDIDAEAASSDYLDDHSVTNDMAVLTPYTVTFHSFTPEIARVLAGFASARNCILVKSISVQPAGSGGPQNGQPGNVMAGLAGPGMFPRGPAPVPAPAPAPVPAKGGLPTVLKEQLLRVTLQLEVVKLLPSTAK
jgi:hypothetical protein